MEVTVLETRKVDVDPSISIVEESGTDPEDEASQRKLQRARVSLCRRRATPITIISVGVNETTRGREEGRTVSTHGMRRKREREPQSACPRRIGGVDRGVD